MDILDTPPGIPELCERSGNAETVTDQADAAELFTRDKRILGLTVHECLVGRIKQGIGEIAESPGTGARWRGSAVGAGLSDA